MIFGKKFEEKGGDKDKLEYKLSVYKITKIFYLYILCNYKENFRKIFISFGRNFLNGKKLEYIIFHYIMHCNKKYKK